MLNWRLGSLIFLRLSVGGFLHPTLLIPRPMAFLWFSPLGFLHPLSGPARSWTMGFLWPSPGGCRLPLILLDPRVFAGLARVDFSTLPVSTPRLISGRMCYIGKWWRLSLVTLCQLHNNIVGDWKRHIRVRNGICREIYIYPTINIENLNENDARLAHLGPVCRHPDAGRYRKLNRSERRPSFSHIVSRDAVPCSQRSNRTFTRPSVCSAQMHAWSLQSAFIGTLFWCHNSRDTFDLREHFYVASGGAVHLSWRKS